MSAGAAPFGQRTTWKQEWDSSTSTSPYTPNNKSESATSISMDSGRITELDDSSDDSDEDEKIEIKQEAFDSRQQTTTNVT